MRKILDNAVYDYNTISDMYPNDYAIVEVVSIDYSNGGARGRVLWLCDNHEEAWDVGMAIESVEITILPGWNRMSTLGGFLS